jgi:hypothetical protein
MGGTHCHRNGDKGRFCKMANQSWEWGDFSPSSRLDQTFFFPSRFVLLEKISKQQ